MRKVDWGARDVAHVVLEDVQRDVGDRLDDFTVTQTDGTGAREIRVSEFTTLNDDAAREFEDGIGSRISRARANRVVDFNSTQPDSRSHRRVRTQAVSAKVALCDRQREWAGSHAPHGTATSATPSESQPGTCSRCKTAAPSQTLLEPASTPSDAFCK